MIDPAFDSDHPGFGDFSFAAVDPSTLVRPPCALCQSLRFRERYPLKLGSIVRCEECGFNFVSPRLPAGWLFAKTQTWAASDVLDDERLRIAFDRRTLMIFENLLARCERLVSGSGRRLLDVGCSSGAFMTVARERGWEATGIEIGTASANYARDRLGLNVVNGSLFEFDGAPGSYDAIVFLEVIEHLEDPRRALERLIGWLAPGGVLLLSTPNFDSLYRRLFGTRWWVVNCEDEHIQFFTPATLARMLDAAGLSTVDRRIRGIDFAGLVSCALSRPRSRPLRNPGAVDEPTGYHHARLRKERLKASLGRVGLLGLVRHGLSGLEWLFSVRGSPLYAMGEQIVVIARRSQ